MAAIRLNCCGSWPLSGSSGLKLEHVVIYGTFCGFLVLHSNLFRFRPWGYFSAMMCLAGPRDLPVDQLSLVVESGARLLPQDECWLPVEHQVQPLVVVALVCAWAKTISADQLTTALRRTVNVLVWALAGVLLILWCMRTGAWGCSFHGFLPTVQNRSGVLSVEMGRLGGSSSHPSEAGLCYSPDCWRGVGSRANAGSRHYGGWADWCFYCLAAYFCFSIYLRRHSVGGDFLVDVKTRRMRIFNLKSAVVLTGS